MGNKGTTVLKSISYSQVDENKRQRLNGYWYPTKRNSQKGKQRNIKEIIPIPLSWKEIQTMKFKKSTKYKTRWLKNTDICTHLVKFQNTKLKRSFKQLPQRKNLEEISSRH